MPYTIKSVHAGDYMTTYIYVERPTPRGRSKKRGATKDAQSRLNARRAESRLIELIHENFTPNDFAARLDYNRFIAKFGENPTPRQAYDRLRYALGKLRRVYDALGVPLEYIYNTEIGARSGKVHHHLILRGSDDPATRMQLRHELEQIWRYGYGNTQPLIFNEYGLRGLAHYFIKEPQTSHRWAASIGLKRPSEENGLVQREYGAITAKIARHIDEHPYDTEYIRRHIVGEGYVPVDVRTTAVSSYEQGTPSGIPGECDPERRIKDGLVMPDYGGYFVEIWSYAENTKLFVPIGSTNSKKNKAKKEAQS